MTLGSIRVREFLGTAHHVDEHHCETDLHRKDNAEHGQDSVVDATSGGSTDVTETNRARLSNLWHEQRGASNRDEKDTLPHQIPSSLTLRMKRRQ